MENETQKSDEAGNLHKPFVSVSLPTDKQIELKADEYMTEVQSNAYAYDRNTGWQYSDVIKAFREGAKWARVQGDDDDLWHD